MSQIRISQRGGWLMSCSNEVKKSVGLRCFYRLDSFFVRDRFIGHVGLLQNSIYNLLFQHNAALGLLFEQLSWQLLRLEVATELLNSLHTQTVHFVADQRLRHFDRVGSQQTVHHLVFNLGLDGLTQLTLHILAHFSTEAFQTAFFNTEQGKEVIIQLRQLRCSDAVNSNGELSSFTCQS